MIKRFFKITALPPYVDFAILILRVGVGILLIPHGYSKLLKIFNGDFGFADPIGIGSTISLYATVFAEMFCSGLLVLGLFTRPVLSILIFTMLVIVFVVHGNDGLGKMERGLLFLIPYFSLFIWGPGRYSLDYFIFGKKRKSLRR